MKIKGLKNVIPKGREKKVKKEKPKKRIRLMVMISFIVILVVLGAAIIYFKTSKDDKKQEFSFGSMQGGWSQFDMTGDMVSASGVTSVGVTEERFEVENLTTGLKIEELYVHSEEEITEGTKVLKLSEESVEKARKELEQTLKEADLAYRAGVIEFEQSKITAEYDRDSTLLEGQQAKAVYEETLSGLTSSVERAKDELEQAKQDIAEYQSYVNNDSYKSHFKVDEYQGIYDKTLAALIDKMEEWGVSWPQVTGQGGGAVSNPSGNTNMGGTSLGGSTNGSFSGTGMGSGSFGGIMPASLGAEETNANSPSSEQIQVLASLYDVLEQQRKYLDQAQSDYQEALENAAFELQTLQLQLPELENALAEAEKNYKNQVLQAELTYETALTNAKSAETDYETAMERAETTFESLKSDWEDARDNLELFESSVGNGYFYASGNGTILRTMARAGQNLSSESTIFMYSNPEEMTVTVSVGQADIAGIALDDSVYIQSTEFGGFEGVVTEVNPVSNSDSRTNVTYTVTVQFSGSGSKIGANESVSVVFGMDSETIQRMNSMSQSTRPQGGQMQEGSSSGQMPQGGRMPEGFDPGQMFQGGQMSEGFDPGQMFQGGRMPEGFDPGQMFQGGQMPEGFNPGSGNWGSR